MHGETVIKRGLEFKNATNCNKTVAVTMYYLNKKHPFVFSKLSTKSEAVKIINLLQTH